MLDREIEIAGWRAGWLARSLPAFQYYANITSFALSISICALGLIGYFGIRRCTKQLQADASNRACVNKEVNKQVLKVSRGHWYIANIYLLNVLIIALVDAYIGIVSLKDDAAKKPETYNASYFVEVAACMVYITAIFLSSFFIVPLLQMLLVTSLLARFMRKRGVTSLSEYMLEARMCSTHIAQAWTMFSFLVTAWWAPLESHDLLRWVLLEATIGSSLAWLDASFAFNFCYRRLANKNFEVATGGITEIVRMFATTVKVVHTMAGEKDMLPRYEETSQPALTIRIGEEEALLVR